MTEESSALRYRRSIRVWTLLAGPPMQLPFLGAAWIAGHIQSGGGYSPGWHLMAQYAAYALVVVGLLGWGLVLYQGAQLSQALERCAPEDIQALASRHGHRAFKSAYRSAAAVLGLWLLVSLPVLWDTFLKDTGGNPLVLIIVFPIQLGVLALSAGAMLGFSVVALLLILALFSLIGRRAQLQASR